MKTLYDLSQKIEELSPDIKALESYAHQQNLLQTVAELTSLTQDPSFWERSDSAKILKELQNTQDLYTDISEIIKEHAALSELVALAENDAELQHEIESNADSLRRRARAIKVKILLSQEYDKEDCYLDINAGAGGTESQDWAEILLRMYIRFCEQHHFKYSLVDYQSGEGAGIKSATLYIQGKYAYGFLKNEHGIHRLVRISPFDANQRRHTSFAGVFITPDIPAQNINIDPKDLRIDTYRAGGAGGQHVNKTDSAVRITHLPTNIVVQCQNERSQLQNKEVAMKMLAAKLQQRADAEHAERQKTMERKTIEWGSQIRSYVLHPYKMVKDHRTNHESSQADTVLDGALMPFIEANLLKTAQE